jgi:hypothetical protein
MRKGLLISVAAMGLVAAAGTAHAAAPVQEVFTEPATIVLPGGEFCAFDVQIDIEQNFRTSRSQATAPRGSVRSGPGRSSPR